MLLARTAPIATKRGKNPHNTKLPLLKAVCFLVAANETLATV